MQHRHLTDAHYEAHAVSVALVEGRVKKMDVTYNIASFQLCAKKLRNVNTTNEVSYRNNLKTNSADCEYLGRRRVNKNAEHLLHRQRRGITWTKMCSNRITGRVGS
jgi:hypothetical protein